MLALKIDALKETLAFLQHAIYPNHRSMLALQNDAL